MILLTDKVEDTLAWVLRSFEASKDGGSAAWYGPRYRWYRGGWEKSYPETTGYLIPTLLQWAYRLNRPNLQEKALAASDWLCRIQLSNGLWNSGVVGGQKPSFFNTCMIFWGLDAAQALSPSKLRKSSLEKAAAALVKAQDFDGLWRQFAYVHGHTPAYYTYALAALSAAAKAHDLPNLQAATDKGIEALLSHLGKNQPLHHLGFNENGPAFTHNVGYTLQGLLALHAINHNEKCIERAQALAQQLLHEVAEHRKMPGAWSSYGADLNYQCVTGQFQIAECFYRLGHFNEANQLVNEALQAQLSPTKKQQLRGAWPGSWPLNGAYMSHRYPNWAAKFFLDTAALAMDAGFAK